MIKTLWRRFRRWRCRRSFRRLPPDLKAFAEYMEIDPDSLIDRGEL